MATREAGGRKRRTHEKILRAATRAFRADGLDGIGIPELMQRAGLTHGGFYAHFASKEALIAAACAQGLAENAERVAAAAAAAPPAEALAVIIDGYLSAFHRDRPATGCVLPALAGDVARQPAPVRHAFTDAFARYTDAVARFLPHATAEARHDAALVLIAGMAGAVLLARAVDDPALSDCILEDSRAFYLAAFAGHNADAASAPLRAHRAGPVAGMSAGGTDTAHPPEAAPPSFAPRRSGARLPSPATPGTGARRNRRRLPTADLEASVARGKTLPTNDPSGAAAMWDDATPPPAAAGGAETPMH